MVVGHPAGDALVSWLTPAKAPDAVGCLISPIRPGAWTIAEVHLAGVRRGI